MDLTERVPPESTSVVGRRPGATDGRLQLAALKVAALQRIIHVRGAPGLGARGQLLPMRKPPEKAIIDDLDSCQPDQPDQPVLGYQTWVRMIPSFMIIYVCLQEGFD